MPNVNFQLRIEKMTSEELKQRTKEMSLNILRLVATVPKTREGDVIVKQIIRSATSVAANYRAACKARSRADFINKIGIVEEEADETTLWLDYLLELSLVDKNRCLQLLQETKELVAIFAASAITAKSKRVK
ncbi:MAG: four helix bundle protein [Ignavibacteriales bacterium]|nr:four helix bundle protein [Ignavibacteriales bacterium]